MSDKTSDDRSFPRDRTMIDTSALEDESLADEPTRVSEPQQTEVDEEEPGKTIMFRSPFEEPAPTARLIAIFGNDRGREFVIPEGTVVVGRSLECGIVLNDPTVSRKHFELRNEGGRYILKDLGSGNGTRVAGQRVTEITLEEGMQIEVGQTLLTFSTDAERTKAIPAIETPEPKPPQVEQVQAKPPPRIEVGESHRTFPFVPIAIAGLSFVIAVLLVLHFALDIRIFSSKEKEAPSVQPSVEANELYERGLKAIQSREWDNAISLLEQALEKNPSLSNAEATLARARDEKRNVSLLAAAKTSLEKGKTAEAASLLDRIKDDSTYYPEAKKLKQQLDETIVTGEIERIRSLLAAKKKGDARLAYLALLQEHPDNQTVLAFYDELVKAGVALERPRPVSSESPYQPHSEPTVASSTAPSKPTQSKGTKLDISKVLQLYNGGAFEQAVAELRNAAETLKGDDANRARDLAERIERFASAYLEGKAALEAKRLDKAEQGLILALRADREINGHYDPEIRSLLGDTYRSRAAAAMQETDYVAAAKNARRAISYKPNDQLAKGILDKCIAVAQGMLNAAIADLQAGRKDAARQKLKDVLDIVPPTHELSEKASELMQQTR